MEIISKIAGFILIFFICFVLGYFIGSLAGDNYGRNL